MLNWLNQSLTRRISSLSVVLLSFLLIVIIYSVYKLESINQEMREVAEVDIPLTTTLANIETLQLKQDVLIEQLHPTYGIAHTDPTTRAQLLEQINRHDEHMTLSLESIMQSLQAGLQHDRVYLEAKQHRQVVHQIQQLHSLRRQFQQQAHTLLQKAATPQFDTAAQWQQIKTIDQQLDQSTESLLLTLETMTQEIAHYAQQHEQGFMQVNAILGIAALTIGLYLTIYIVQTLRQRLGHIQSQISHIQSAIRQHAPLQASTNTQHHHDELADLEQDLNQLVAQLSDAIHNREEVEARLIELATTDKLTGAYNRHKWDEHMRVAINLAQRGTPFCLALLDVDHFKQINDTYGHDLGDQVLQQLVQQLRQQLDQPHTIFRLGGEEFAMVMRQLTLDQAQSKADHLRQQLAIQQQEGIPSYTVSIGVSDYQPGDSPDTLFKRADEALYEAKSQGRNQVVCH
ncbi:hypothetical protein BFW38_02210 [Terasakiispira papahanaumokuakeensis]|uniref:diguanylate cyclase n=1 Tax=Terasakiispira papahanaumokuakeensis TaxID=197479 RepID=A0A1E2VEM3_9GAMM|nr:hypothetical protein BFW38_02210 [Terasakiispira papahanaumokuakeensis]